MERREFIALLSAATGGLVAGCGGDSSETATPGGTDTGGATPASRTETERVSGTTTTESGVEATTTREPIPPNKLVPADGEEGDRFGDATAIDGETAIVGATDVTPGTGRETGAAYAFTLTDGRWTQEAELVPEPRLGGAQIGNAVAIDGQTALVSAYTASEPNGNGSGAVYVFSRSNGSWSQQATLVASDGDRDDLFGSAVALDGDTAVVGAESQADGISGGGGAGYVFTRSGGSWSQQDKIEAESLGSGRDFGRDVSVHGDRLVVGAPGRQSEPATAYVYERSGTTWSQTAVLPADGPRSSETLFGHTVSVFGSTVLVGAPDEKVGGEPTAGAVYVYTPDGGAWSQQARLTADDQVPAARFGADVTADENSAVVGAPLQFTGETTGEVFVFQRSGGNWTIQDTFESPEIGRDGLGDEVDTDGERIVAGALTATTRQGEEVGAAFVFDR